MSDIPSDLRYTSSHEWVREEDDGTVTIGITDHAQSLLGEIVFVELPQVDSDIISGAESGVLESVKAASDLYAPISGEIIDINQDLVDSPNLVNEDPYGEGWIFKIKPSHEEEMGDLLDADSYEQQVEDE